MVNSIENENRIIPYKMLVEAVDTTDGLLDGIVPDGEMPSLSLGLKYLSSSLHKTLEKAREGLPIIGFHFSLPAEFLTCFDCVPVCIEGTSFLLAALLPDGIEKYYDIINNWGHPFHTCSSQKGPMGMSHDDLIKFDALLTPTSPCDNTCASYPFFEHQMKFPLVIADMPYLHEEKSYVYYGEQLKKSLIKLGKVIGQEPDFEKLKKSIELENEITNLQLEIFELKKAIPCPVENMYNALSSAATIFMSAQQEKLDF